MVVDGELSFILLWYCSCDQELYCLQICLIEKAILDVGNSICGYDNFRNAEFLHQLQR